MSTQPPSAPSPNDQNSTTSEPAPPPDLLDVRAKLAAEGVEWKNLVVLLMSGSELIIGECADAMPFLTDSGEHFSVFEKQDFIAVNNPKRISRVMLQNTATGEIRAESRLSDFDFVNAGTVEFKPNGIFFLDWCDYQTQFNCCAALLGFLIGRREQRAKEAGILPASDPGAGEKLQKLMLKIRDGK